jgi:hypothetical protein
VSAAASLPEDTLAGLLVQLEAHDAEANADEVVKLGKVEMTNAGTLVVPGLHGSYAMTDWARGQLARLVGLRWERFFDNASRIEMAEEMNKRLARATETVRVRTTREAPHGSEANGTITALVSPTYAAIPDGAVARVLGETLQGVEGDARIVRSNVTDMTTSYVVRVGEPYHVGGPGEVGEVWGGLLVRNSNVGYAKLVVSLHLTRVACTNGLVIALPEATLVRAVHRGVEVAQVREKIVAGLKDVTDKLHRGARVLADSVHERVADAEVEVRELLRASRLPLGLAADVMDAFAREPAQTRFAVSQAVTWAAQRTSPETRYEMERAAGIYLTRGG